MPDELVKASSVSVPAIGGGQSLPVLVEHVGPAARFAWDEFFYAEHHNPHTQKAYQSAVRRFLAWCKGEGVELIGRRGFAVPLQEGLRGDRLRRASR